MQGINSSEFLMIDTVEAVIAQNQRPTIIWFSSDSSRRADENPEQKILVDNNNNNEILIVLAIIIALLNAMELVIAFLYYINTRRMKRPYIIAQNNNIHDDP